MTITVFHGEDTQGSYQALNDEILPTKKSGAQIFKLTGKELTLADFFAHTAQDDFFASKKIIVISGLLARPKSKVRDQIIAAALQSDAEIYLWENKKLTPASEKLLLGAKQKHFPLQPKIWAFLAKLSPHNDDPAFISLYDTLCAEEDPLYVLAMVIWQVQQLLDILAGTWKGAPFNKNRLQKQAAQFSAEQLTTWHQKLIDLDYQLKSGQLKLGLKQKLLLLLLTPV